MFKLDLFPLSLLKTGEVCHHQLLVCTKAAFVCPANLLAVFRADSLSNPMHQTSIDIMKAGGSGLVPGEGVLKRGGRSSEREFIFATRKVQREDKNKRNKELASDP